MPGVPGAPMQRRTKFTIFYYLVALALLVFAQYYLLKPRVHEISYSQFRIHLDQGQVEKVEITTEKIRGTLRKATDSASVANADPKKDDERTFVVNPLPENLRDESLIKDLQSKGVEFSSRQENSWLENILFTWVLPLGILAVFWVVMMRRMAPNNMALNVGKNKAKIYAKDDATKVSFKDVAGVDEAVEEVREIVEFLRNPKKYTRLGGKLPRGVLLVGPPGTGKTLLARAVAGEAAVPFFHLSGSDFVEMFVGVGASRVRDLFAQAKAKAPCIIFIDEIDAIGKSRAQGAFVSGGMDERESTLNQLLVEMDGFDPSLGVILMAATNRPDVLDPALLRPGRFDRQVLLDRPDMNGREEIFKVHTRTLILDREVDVRRLASQTPGFAGSEIANVCNEAALLAARKGHERIQMRDFEDAIERVIGGLEKKNKLINENERRVIAYHESGHAIVGHFTPGADPIQKVSIVPRGFGALGYTLQMPLEDRYLMTKEELLGKITGLLGGRAAEDVAFGVVSTGAANDLERVTDIARAMIMQYGMSARLPNIALSERRGNRGFLGEMPSSASYSESTQQLIDEEIGEIINASYERAKEMLRIHREKLESLSNRLLAQEVVNRSDLEEILGESPKMPEHGLLS
jgi:cell division protease FtsH